MHAITARLLHHSEARVHVFHLCKQKEPTCSSGELLDKDMLRWQYVEWSSKDLLMHACMQPAAWTLFIVHYQTLLQSSEDRYHDPLQTSVF